MGFGAGQIVYESDLTAIKPSSVIKGGSTSRNTNTILTDDPDLSGITLDPGNYAITVTLFFTVASTTPKLKTRWAFTGSWGSPMRLCHGPGSTNTAVPDQSTPNTHRGYDAATQDAVYNKDTGAAYGAIIEWCDKVTISSTGTFSVQWAQQTSNGSNVTIQTGSSVKIEALP